MEVTPGHIEKDMDCRNTGISLLSGTLQFGIC